MNRNKLLRIVSQNLAEQQEEEVINKSMSLCFFALRNQVQTLERDTPRGVALRGGLFLW